MWSVLLCHVGSNMLRVAQTGNCCRATQCCSIMEKNLDAGVTARVLMHFYESLIYH